MALTLQFMNAENVINYIAMIVLNRIALNIPVVDQMYGLKREQ